MNKINWEDYFNRTVSVGMQFDLIRAVISTFKDTPEAINKFAKKELEKLRKNIINYSKSINKSPNNHWAWKEGEIKKFIYNWRETYLTSKF